MWHSNIGNCDIDFFNFCHRQVWNLEILNLFEGNQNFAVIFWKYQNQNQKSTKYFATSQKPSIVPLKFCEISLDSWNLISYCKISQILVKFGKSLKGLGKILLKWLGKKSNIGLILSTFDALKNGRKLGNFCLSTITKVHGIQWRFFQS
jgi:hypothetical protein